MRYRTALIVMTSGLCVTPVSAVDGSVPRLNLEQTKNYTEWYACFNDHVNTLSHQEQAELWECEKTFKKPILQQITHSVKEKISRMRFLPMVSAMLFQHVDQSMDGWRGKRTDHKKDETEKWLLNFIWNVWIFCYKDADKFNISETLVTPLKATQYLSKQDVERLGRSRGIYYDKNCAEYIANNRQYLKTEGEKISIDDCFKSIQSKYTQKNIPIQRITVIFKIIKEMIKASEEGDRMRRNNTPSVMEKAVHGEKTNPDQERAQQSRVQCDQSNQKQSPYGVQASNALERKREDKQSRKEGQHMTNDKEIHADFIPPDQEWVKYCRMRLE